jgi:hypothetical protein
MHSSLDPSMMQENNRVQISTEVSSIQCVLGASGSAIKGVRIFPSSDGAVLLASVGYDQRLSLWNLSDCDGSEEEKAKGDATEGTFPRVIQVYSSNSVRVKRKYDEESGGSDCVLQGLDEDVLLSTEVAAPPVHFSREHIHIFPPAKGSSDQGATSRPLTWLAGSVVNIGDVNGIALMTGSDSAEMIAVVGEGVQVFQRM